MTELDLGNGFVLEMVEDDSGNDAAFVGYDPDGEHATMLGGKCYCAAMDTDDPRERHDYFMAAERFARLGASHNNMFSWCNLGYIYSYGRCEGEYPFINGCLAEELSGKSEDEMALYCYQRAMDLGNAQAAYRVGDLTADGRGTEADPEKAVELYNQAWEMAQNWAPVIWGSVAFRLAQCYEEGKGCEQNFILAHTYYRRAITGLQIAVDEGDWFYKSNLRKAKVGRKRMEQEISGEY